MYRLSWLALILVAGLVVLPLEAQEKDGDKKNGKKSAKEDKEAKKKALEQYKRLEKVYTPTEIKLLRFCTFRTPTNKYVGEYGPGELITVTHDGDGNPQTITEKLQLAPKSRQTYWRGDKIKVYGQARGTLPEHTRIELYLVYNHPTSDPIAWREVTLKGRPKNGWWSFEATFTFPRKKVLEVSVYDRQRKRSKIKSFPLNIKILDGNYWIIARYVKSKQNRFVRKDISQVQGKLAKKDRQNYLEDYARAHVPRPNFDPSQEASIAAFNRQQQEATKGIQNHYIKIINQASLLNKQIDRYFAAAYRSNFVDKKKKFDKEAWEKWLFNNIYRRLRIRKKDSEEEKKSKEEKRSKLTREIEKIAKFGRPDSFKKEPWKDFIKNDFMPKLTVMLEQNFLYRHSHLAIRYNRSHTYLNEMVYAILKKGVHYTAQLYAAHKIQPDVDDEMPVLPLVIGPASPRNYYLRMLFRRISRETGITVEDLKRGKMK